MINTYTIVDNFDKFDFSWAEAAATLDIFGANVEWEGHLQSLSQVQVAKLNETMHPFEDHYSQTPYSFNKSQNMVFGKYIPDMVRYITGHRFYVENDTFLNGFQYPTADELYPQPFSEGNNTEYKKMGLNFRTMGGPSYWYFDLTEVDTKFNTSSKLYDNEFKFEDYYLSDSGGKRITLSPNVTSLGNDIYGTQDIKGILEMSSPAYSREGHQNGPFARNYMLFNLPAPGDMVHEFKYDILYDEPSDLDASPMDLFETSALHYKAFRSIFERMFFYKLYFPLIHQRFTPKHVYFVADLPKGTSNLPMIDHDDDPATPAVNKLDYVVNKNVVLMDSQYNYYAEYAEGFSEQYAEAELAGGTTELWLPNLYTYYSLRTKKLDYYKRLVKMDQPVTIKADEFSVHNYYEISQNANPFEQVIQANRNRNITVTDKNFLNDANAIAEIFPMYNKITIPSKESGFMDILKTESTFLSLFMQAIASYFSVTSAEQSSKHTFAMHNGSSKFSSNTLQIMDFSNFSLVDNTWGEKWSWCFQPVRGVLIGSGLDFINEDAAATKNWIAYAFANMLLGKKEQIDEYFNQRMLTIIETYQGKKCHSEVLAFEIVKFKLINGKKTHIQSIFLPSSYSDEEISYLDTQIFYDQEYIYEIFTHSLVIGTEYSFNYKAPGDGSQGSKIVKLQSKHVLKTTLVPPHNFSRPKAIIIRAPYYNTDSLIADNELLGETETKETLTLIDKPPLPPDIVFHPYKDDSSKILALLNVNYGERSMFPIAVFPEDNDKINKQKQSQGMNNGLPPGYITFKTDDAVGDYYIYRTARKPTSWQDFHDAHVTILNSKENSGYEDDIFPNTDYYYFARLQDVHGNVSNPTAVFYIRIVKEGGFPPYLIMRVHNFLDAVPPPTYERSFKKYLKIRLPADTRSIVNADEGINSATIGYRKTNGGQLKKYKIRITSKKTGKKVDINVDIKKKDLLGLIGNPLTETSLVVEEQKAIINAIEGELNNPFEGSDF